MFSSKNFMVLGFRFKSLNHFELIFEYGERQWYSFFLLHVAVQFFQHRLLKRFSFMYILGPNVKHYLALHGLVSLSSLQSIYVSASMPKWHCFDSWSFVTWLEVREHDTCN